MERAELLSRLNHKQDEIRKTLSGAMELVQTLPMSQKLNFAYLALRLGHKAAESEETTPDAVHYFKVVLNTVDSPETVSIRSNVSESDEEVSYSKSSSALFELRIKAQLSLAFCYKEMQ